MVLRGTSTYLLVAGVVACASDSSSPVVSGALPPSFRLIGAAESTFTDGRTVRCQFAFNVTLGTESQRTERFVRYPAVQGGSAGRSVVPGFSFVGDVNFTLASARFFPPDSVELILGDTTRHDSRFWRGLAFLGGGVVDGGTGKWACAPFDINAQGIVDTSGVAIGTWRLEAQ
jgi:hypothetical protein